MKISLFLVVFALALLTAGGCKQSEVKESEKSLFLRPSDLTEFGYNQTDFASREVFTKTAYFDGSTDIDYEYDNGENAEMPLLLQANATIERKKSDAAISHTAMEYGYFAGLKIAGVQAEEVKDFYRYGEASKFYVLKKDGKPVGNFFVTRDGNKVYVLTVVGVYFEDAKLWREMVEPKLKLFSSYSTK